MRVSISEYAAKHGKAPVTVRQMIQRGNLKTAEKIGGVWTIEDTEPYPDNRRNTPVSSESLETRNGMYVIDEIAYRTTSADTTFVRIGDKWYRKGKCLKGLSTTNPAPIPVAGDPWDEDETGKRNESWFFAAQNYGCVPRDTGFILAELGRVATPQEVADIALKYNATKIGERNSTLGALYGPDYEVTVRYAILELPGDVNPTVIESEVRKKGIDAVGMVSASTMKLTLQVRIG